MKTPIDRRYRFARKITIITMILQLKTQTWKQSGCNDHPPDPLPPFLLKDLGWGSGYGGSFVTSYD
jgi:hypothetical protein